MAVNEPWLALHDEAVVEPELPIIDAHHHLWTRPPQRPLETYDVEDYLRDARRGHRITASVHIECNNAYRQDGPAHLRPVGETQAINAVADSALAHGVAVAAGIVGFAQLELNEQQVDEVLQAHQAAAPRRFRGIRQTNAWDADETLRYRHIPAAPHRLLDPAYRRGYARLEHHGLSFDSWVYHTQLGDVLDVARAFPGIPLIVNHVGGPLGVGVYRKARGEVLAQWQRSLAALAGCDNVTLKLGGLAMHCIGLGFGHRTVPPGSDDMVAATAELYHRAIDLFTPARCMFESNFPVDKESCSAVVVWNSFKKISARYSAGERADLFGGTAQRVYRLSPDLLAPPLQRNPP